MPDNFTGRRTEGPATGGEAVVPSDTVDLTNVSRALYVGVSGDVTVIMRDGQELTFSNMPVGWHPLRIKRVMDTGTDADLELVAVW